VSSGPDTFASQVHVDKVRQSIWRYNLPGLPGNQIRFHLDPTVPQRWWPTFKEGVEAWNVAFAEAGFPNAVRAVLPTDTDWPSDYDAGDARFNSISWVLNDEVYSLGAAKVDPRSGEIIVSTIIMSDGWVKSYLGDLDWMRPDLTTNITHGYALVQHGTQQGAAAARGRQRQSSQNLDAGEAWFEGLVQGELKWSQVVVAGLKDVVMHEVGHTLGLRHNFKGSMGISNECLKNASCTAQHSTTVSVMDYMPVNLPSDAGDEIDTYAPTVGAYDKLAIRYGYTEHLDESARRALLEEIEQLPFCSDEELHLGEDPHCTMYDASSRPLKYYKDMLARIQHWQANALHTSLKPGDSYTKYGSMVEARFNKVMSIAAELLLWIGGLDTTRAHRGFVDNGSNHGGDHGGLAPIPIADQREAFEMLLEVLRPTRAGLQPPLANRPFLVIESDERADGFGGTESLDLAGDVRYLQERSLAKLLSRERLHRVHVGGQLGGLEVRDVLQAVVALLEHTLSSFEVEDWDLQVFIVERLVILQNDTKLSEAVRSEVALAHHGALEAVMREAASQEVEPGSEKPPVVQALRRQHLQRLLQLFAKEDPGSLLQMEKSKAGENLAVPLCIIIVFLGGSISSHIAE